MRQNLRIYANLLRTQAQRTVCHGLSGLHNLSNLKVAEFHIFSQSTHLSMEIGEQSSGYEALNYIYLFRDL